MLDDGTERPSDDGLIDGSAPAAPFDGVKVPVTALDDPDGLIEELGEKDTLGRVLGDELIDGLGDTDAGTLGGALEDGLADVEGGCDGISEGSSPSGPGPLALPLGTNEGLPETDGDVDMLGELLGETLELGCDDTLGFRLGPALIEGPAEIEGGPPRPEVGVAAPPRKDGLLDILGTLDKLGCCVPPTAEDGPEDMVGLCDSLGLPLGPTLELGCNETVGPTLGLTLTDGLISINDDDGGALPIGGATGAIGAIPRDAVGLNVVEG